MRNENLSRRPAVALIDMPFVWAIGIYLGSSPLQFFPAPEIENPVLSVRDVTDVPAMFVADPFMIRAADRWYMFFEVYNTRSGKGEIGLAVSESGLDWQYRQIVLDEPYHLSYPYVFEWQGERYMIPETLGADSIRLYKAVSFPDEWRFVGSLIEGRYADPSIFYFDGKWWMFACSSPSRHDTLRLYFADELIGPWIEHPRSPIVNGNNRTARPSGRVLVLGDKIIRYAQDCYPNYGTQVRAFEISRLTPTDYYEQECAASPILTAGKGDWNAMGMHNIDPHLLSDVRWIACVDGMSSNAEQKDELL